MSDTRLLLEKIAAFRRRLEEMPRLTPASLPETVVPTENRPTSSANLDLPAQVEAGSRTQAILEQSFRELTRVSEEKTPEGIVLTARARRLLCEAHELIRDLRALADDPLLAGPPPDNNGTAEIDSLALYYRETAAILEPAIRMTQSFPESPSLQLRLCDGLEGILMTVRQRQAVLERVLQYRRRDDEQVNTLCAVLLDLEHGRAVALDAIVGLADALLAESPSQPLRFLETSPSASQQYLGGTCFPPPARFVACHSLNSARVLVRMLRNDPQWRDHPHGPVIAALLHDAGMLRIPFEALATAGPLSDEHRRIVEGHPRLGAEWIAHRLPELASLVDAIGTHHERMDGTGYPAGIKQDEIPVLARLLAVADTYAALVCQRAHRGPADPRTALTDTLLLAEQNYLDRFAAEKLLVLGMYPAGAIVELADGSIARVLANHHGRKELFLARRPIVHLLIDGSGQMLPIPQTIDLAEDESAPTVVRTLSRGERTAQLGRHYPEWV